MNFEKELFKKIDALTYLHRKRAKMKKELNIDWDENNPYTSISEEYINLRLSNIDNQIKRTKKYGVR